VAAQAAPENNFYFSLLRSPPAPASQEPPLRYGVDSATERRRAITTGTGTFK